MNNNKKPRLKKALLIALSVMLGLLVIWHLVLPMFNIAIVMSALVWGTLVATVVLLSISILLFYILSGIGIIIICILSCIWFLGTFVLFPFLFPFLLPLLILLLFIAFVRKKEEA